MTKNGFSLQTKSYLKAFLAGLPLSFGLVFLGVILAQRGVPFVFDILIMCIVLSPFIIVWLHILYRILVPVTGGMPLKTFRQWVLLYPFVAGFGSFWAFLAFIFDICLPFLERETREILLPISVILGLTLFLTLTRLRHRTERFLNRVFGTELAEETDGTSNV